VQSARVKLVEIAAFLGALLVPAGDAGAESQEASPETGEEYHIVSSYETSEEASDGSSGTSSGRDVFVERVVGHRDGGLELEYDLPNDVPAEDRGRYWQFPARVLKRPGGPMLLLNREALEARLETWLNAAGWTRAVCGRWIFTWNAFRIECDPESVLETIERLDLRSTDLREGARYQDPVARAPGTLARLTGGRDGARFAVVLEPDPDKVRRARAESDVAVGEIMRTPATLEAALRERSRESVSGRIEVTFEADANGNAWRRTTVTRLEIVAAGGRRETRTATETVERRPASDAAAHQ
jgi:hypothetical protein